MIGPVSRPLAPAYLKGIVVPEPASFGQTTTPSSPVAIAPASEPPKAPLSTPKQEALTSQERQELEELRARDREVRAHEQAHMAAAGQYARSGASFQFQVGPDGTRYAVGGEVSIDLSEAATPEATIQKAQIIRRAALAPAEPSGQDRRVASLASAMEASAKADIAKERRAELDATPSTGVPAEPQAQPQDIGSRGSELIARRSAEIRGAEAYAADRADTRPRSTPSSASLDTRL